MLTRCAVRDLLADPATPADMKQWLKDTQPQLGTVEDERQFLLHTKVGIYPHGVDGLAFWAVYPDLVAGAAADKDRKVAPFDTPESQLHFVDLEMLNADPARQSFAADLSNKPKLADIPRDMKDPRWQKAGMLPFRIIDCYTKTVELMKAGHLKDTPGQFPRDEHAAKWAGCLAHYAADNLMPMHTTVDYQAYSFFPGLAKAPKVHFDMEYRMVDDDGADYPELREAFWPLFVTELADARQPEAGSDLWTDSVQIALQSYDALPMIGQAARGAYLQPDGKLKPWDASAFFSYSGQYEGQQVSILQLKARQEARAVRWIEYLWIRAWQDAHAEPAAK